MLLQKIAASRFDLFLKNKPIDEIIDKYVDNTSRTGESKLLARSMPMYTLDPEATDSLAHHALFVGHKQKLKELANKDPNLKKELLKKIKQTYRTAGKQMNKHLKEMQTPYSNNAEIRRFHNKRYYKDKVQSIPGVYGKERWANDDKEVLVSNGGSRRQQELALQGKRSIWVHPHKEGKLPDWVEPRLEYYSSDALKRWGIPSIMTATTKANALSKVTNGYEAKTIPGVTKFKNIKLQDAPVNEGSLSSKVYNKYTELLKKYIN